MKIKLTSALLFCILFNFVYTQPVKNSDTLRIGFWNVENLFDLEDDPDKNDEEFTPNGKKHVTQEILDLKLNQLTKALRDLNVDILGLCEVENRVVMELLNKRYAEKDYEIIHYESPDRRGIDVGLFFDPSRFRVILSKPISVQLGEGRVTRDILYVMGEFEDITLHLFVNHWPSHWGGTEATIPLRKIAAKTLRREVDLILDEDPEAEILIMGDLNDNPWDPSVKTHLGSTLEEDSVFVEGKYLWNLMAPFVGKSNGGTYKYRGKDKIIDHIIISPGLNDSKGLSVLSQSIQILDTPEYRQQEGNYTGYPFRFWAGNKLLGGYSDHLAIKVAIIKK